MKITRRQLRRLIVESIDANNSLANDILKMLSFREKPFLTNQSESSKIEKILEILQDDNTRKELEDMLEQFNQGITNLRSGKIGPNTMDGIINSVEDAFSILKSKL